MKLIIHCHLCSFEGHGLSDAQVLELRDDAVYHFECSRGHKITQAVLNERFEILFESGTLALLDGYAREAVSSFVASMERFHEFCVEVFLEGLGDFPPGSFEDTWKFVSRQSERQLGAFLFLYLAAFGDVPPWKAIDREVSFRNDVIHKGYIPNSDKAMKFREVLFDYMGSTIQRLKTRFPDPMSAVLTRHMEDLRERMGGGPGNWRHLRTMLRASTSLFMPENDPPDFRSRLEELRESYGDGWSYAK